jgi:hypothetical protein
MSNTLVAPVPAPPWRLIDGEALATLRELPSDSVEAVITDPPYSSGGQFRGDRRAHRQEVRAERHEGRPPRLRWRQPRPATLSRAIVLE